eukprot:3348155-Amphidinium_carterae.2
MSYETSRHACLHVWLKEKGTLTRSKTGYQPYNLSRPLPPLMVAAADEHSACTRGEPAGRRRKPNLPGLYKTFPSDDDFQGTFPPKGAQNNADRKTLGKAQPTRKAQFWLSNAAGREVGGKKGYRKSKKTVRASANQKEPLAARETEDLDKRSGGKTFEEVKV